MAVILTNVLHSAASLAAVYWTFSSQSQFRSGPHKSCNSSNLFRSVTGERTRGEAHFVFARLSYCQVADKKLKLSPLPPQRITQIIRTTGAQRFGGVRFCFRGNNEDVKSKGMFWKTVGTFWSQTRINLTSSTLAGRQKSQGNSGSELMKLVFLGK